MSKHSAAPCAQWAEQLTQASRIGEASAALKAHLAACPACAAAHTDYRYAAALLEQAADPDPLPGLPPQLLQVWAAESQRTTAPAPHLAHIGHLEEVPMHTINDKAPPAFPANSPSRQRISHRAVTVMSAIAAVLVIALVTTALIASRVPAKPSATVSSPTSTQSINQTWQALPHLKNVPDDTMLAPSNPRVVYQITQGTQASLRRSDNQGATWKSLPNPPGATPANQAGLYISRTNAQHVLAMVNYDCPSSPTAQAAGVGPLISLSNGNTCSALYFSSTGGESWTPVTLPTHGSLNLFLGLGIVAQEDRLYAILIVEPGYTASELVMSRDDGATWQLADQGLNAGQHCLGIVAAPASGTTLFATTLPDCSEQTNGLETAQVWRSTNAGAQWTPVSTIPATSAFFLKAVNVNGQAQPVLINQSAPLPYGFEFSLDNGKTWQSVPTLSDQTSACGGKICTTIGIVGILNDGSIVEQAKTGFFAWKPGDSGWRKVAPALDAEVVQSLVVSNAGGKETLYLGVRPVQSDFGSAESFYSIVLA
jgi:hypothetical protein